MEYTDKLSLIKQKKKFKYKYFIHSKEKTQHKLI